MSHHSHIPRSQMHSTPRAHYSSGVSRTPVTSRTSYLHAPYGSRSVVPASSFSNPSAPSRGSISIRNPWQNTYSIPVRVGRSSLEPFEDRGHWYSRDPIRLVDTSKPPHCAGLVWDIRIQADNDGYYLHVMPLRGETALPHGYMIKFTVSASIDAENIPVASRLANDQSWTTEIDRLPEDFDAGMHRIKCARLPYEFDDFLHYHSCTYENMERVMCFRLTVKLEVAYEKLGHVVTRHTGLIGAILTQYEKAWDEREGKEDVLQDEITRLNAEHFGETRDLRNELETLRDKNVDILSQISRLSVDHKREYSLLAERHERNIKNLTDSIQTMTEDRQAQDRRLDDQTRVVNQQMAELHTFADKISTLSDEICTLRLSNGNLERANHEWNERFDASQLNWEEPNRRSSGSQQNGFVPPALDRNSSMASSRMDEQKENVNVFDSPQRNELFDASFPSQIDISYSKSEPSAPDESEIPSAPDVQDLPSAPPFTFPTQPAPSFNFGQLSNSAPRPSRNVGSPPTPPRKPQTDPARIENAVEEEDSGVYTLQPIVTLAEIETVSGHEHETLVFERVAKIYRFASDTAEWKERGNGVLQIYHNNEQPSYHMVLRQTLTSKMRINQAISQHSRPAERRKDKVISWYGADWSGIDENEESTSTSFTARFKSSQAASDFLSVFNSIVNNNPNSRSSVPVTVQEVEASPTREEEKAPAVEERPASRDQAVSSSPAKFVFGLAKKTDEDPAPSAKTSPPKSGVFGSASSAFGFNSSFGASQSEGPPSGSFSFASSADPQANESAAPAAPAFGGFGSPGTFSFGSKPSESSAAAAPSSVFGSSSSSFGGNPAFGGFGSTFSAPSSFGGGGDAAPAAAAAAAPASGNDQQGGEDAEEEVVTTFKPLVNLPEIETKSGEENSEVLFTARGKLYRWAMETKEWKERALGNVKLLRDADGICRILVRQEKTEKIRCHHPIPGEETPALMGDNGATRTWGAVDYARGDEDEDPAYHKFCLRFKEESTADRFHNEFLAGQKNNNAANGRKDESPVVEQPPDSSGAPPALERPSPPERSEPQEQQPQSAKPRRKVIRARRRPPSGTPSATATPDRFLEPLSSDTKEASEEVAPKGAPKSKAELSKKFFGGGSSGAQKSGFSFSSNDAFGFKASEPAKVDLQSLDFSTKPIGSDLGSVNVAFGGVRFGNDDGKENDEPEQKSGASSGFGGFGASSGSGFGFGSTFGSSDASKGFSFSTPDKKAAPVDDSGTAPGTDEDNGAEFTLKALVNLKELDEVPTGHEDEEKLHEYPIKKAYRFSTETKEWKIRAEKTDITMWVNRNTNRHRIVVREGETSKLRLNHFVPTERENPSGIATRNQDPVVATWHANDFSDPDEHDGGGDSRTFSIRFMNQEDCRKFVEAFQKARTANAAAAPAPAAPASTFTSPPAQAHSAFKTPPSSGSFTFSSSTSLGPGNGSNGAAPSSGSSFGGFSSFANTFGTSSPEKDADVKENDSPSRGFASLAAGGGGWGDSNKSKSGGFGSFENFSFGDSSAAFGDNASSGFGGSESGGGFGNFGGFGSPAAAARANPSPERAAAGNQEGEGEGDDNCVEYTLKPLVNLEETFVPTGHEHENLLLSVPNSKLYRYTDTIDGGRGWKSRGKGVLQVYQTKDDPSKTRIILREHVTSKLRINSMIPPEGVLSLKNSNPNTRVWNALDFSDVDGGDDDEPTFYQFCVRFEHVASAQEFQQIFEAAQARCST